MMININTSSKKLLETSLDCLIISVFENKLTEDKLFSEVDRKLDGIFKTLVKEKEITGSKGELTLVHTYDKIKPKRVLVVGLGSQESFTSTVSSKISADAIRYIKRKNFSTIGTVIHGSAGYKDLTKELCISLVEGMILGLYSFEKHPQKSNNAEDKHTLNIIIGEFQQSYKKTIEEAINYAKITSEASIFARDLVNQPANLMTPTLLDKESELLATRVSLEYKTFDKSEMEKLKMGALLGVSKGSHEEPKFITLKYMGNPDFPDKIVGLIGKGITFDSGGISIKPAANMSAMKGDMGGAAAVIASIGAVAQLGIKINVMALIPATENLPGGSATKPGDVLTALNGKTIEVENTDAEGRLILADAISYANQLQLSPLIDIATLTGAIGVALGSVSMGLFSNDDTLAGELIASSESTGEKMWRMPLWDEYKDQNKSTVADIKNTGGRQAGSITAAQFLHEFVGETKWAHLDIASVFMSSKTNGIYNKGATGQPVRTIIKLLSMNDHSLFS